MFIVMLQPTKANSSHVQIYLAINRILIQIFGVLLTYCENEDSYAP